MTDEKFTKVFERYCKLPLAIALIPFLILGSVLLVLTFILFVILASLLSPIFIFLCIKESCNIKKHKKGLIIESSLRGFTDYGND